MSSAPARERSRAPLVPRELLLAVLGPRTCPTCLEALGSQLHHELCEVGSG